MMLCMMKKKKEEQVFLRRGRIMSIEKRLLKLLREEVENFGLTPHIRRVLEDEEYVAKQGGDKPDVSVEEFDNFMNGR
jgi:aspartyl-tRNA synthetase